MSPKPFVAMWLILIALSSGALFPSFAVYYGDITDPHVFKGYNLVIVSSLLNKSIVEELTSLDIVVAGYVSIATVGGWEPWAANVSDDMVLTKSDVWNEKVVNVSDPRWKQIILNEAIPYLLSKGFKGVFFDNLDQVDVYPWMADAMVDIIKEVRERYPSLVIVVNRGFTIVDRIAPYINAVLFECFGTYYDFSTGKYKKYTGSDLEWIKLQAERLKALSKKYGFTVLALGYANPQNATQWEEYSKYVAQLASQYGFPVYMSNVYLTYLPSKPPEAPPSEKPGEASTETTETKPPPQVPSASQVVGVLAVVVIAAAVAAVFLRRKMR